MKIGLFITDDIFIKKQILDFLDLAGRLGLSLADFHIFVKAPRVRKEVDLSIKSRPIFENATLEKILIFLSRNFLKFKLSVSWNELSTSSSVTFINSINSPETKILLDKIDIGIFINFDEIVQLEALSKIKRAFNMHNGILPDYRGCQPIVWQMLGREPLSAMTFHVMTEGIDDGDIVYETPFYIDLKKGVYINNIRSFQSIPATLFFGLRRVLFCNSPYIKQEDFSISPQYFKRPSPKKIREIYAKD